MSDLSARIDQTACDKLLQSIHYPFVPLERNEPFPGCDKLVAAEVDGLYRYPDADVDRLFANSVEQINTRDTNTDVTVEDQIFAFGGSIIQQAKLVREAADKPDYEGPDKAELDAIIDGGIPLLGKSLRRVMSDWGIYAWCSHLRVTVKSRPGLKLSSPRIDLTGLRLEVRATGELHAKFPWWNCYQWCLRWRKVHKCERIASLTVSPDLAIDAHAGLEIAALRVLASASFDRLRLDYPILRDLPLEGLANSLLKVKRVPVYDAAPLIATVPVLQSRFVVDSLDLPPTGDGIEIGVNLRQA